MMPDLTRWPHADQLLDEALALPAHERDAFLRRATGADAELLAALQAVVAEAASHDGFLVPGGALSGTLGEEVVQSLGPEESGLLLTPGARVEHYEIVALIGRGGMGEVYRARDQRLHRDVALKVLRARFAREPGRIARFQREARTLASLSHSGIGAIYGVAEDGEIEALVLELVEGPTLAQCLDARALPVSEALAIGRRVAEAIEAAHARGILHRDLKPANIKLAPDGAIKILDFGLAKALAPEPLWPNSDEDLTGESPGILLGTPAYMSPEQVRGEPVDERADIWAFGCIVYEMLAGVRAFPGASATEVMARVLERNPDFDALPASTPESIRRLLRRALEKNPRRRLGHIGDALLEFDDASPAGRGPAVAAVPPRLLQAMLVLMGLALGVLATFLVLRREAAPSRSVSRFMVPLPAGDIPVTGFQPAVALSPDGRTIVYRASRNGAVQLFRRDLDALEPRPIEGTENATGPFFSPDGRSLGFDSDGVLKRVSLTGGSPVVICQAPGGATAAWLPDDSIVFATNTGRVLQRVPASGGAPVPLTALDTSRGATLHLLPQGLPDGRTLLFTIVSGAGRHIALRLPSGEIRVLAEGTHARFLPGGILVFSRSGSLWGAPFDAVRHALTGPAVPLVEGIEHTDNAVLHFATASDGSLTYLPAGQEVGSVQRLVWFDRSGRQTDVDLEPGPYTRVSLSPDDRAVALTQRERGNTDVWVANLERRTLSRLTFEPTIETMPTWSPDGTRIAFRSEREGPGIFVRDAQGAGPTERLTSTDGPIHSPYSWTPDGRTLLLAVFRSFRQQAIASVTPPDQTVRVLLDGEFAQLDPHVSPDGRWLAYQSDESGRFEVYVRPYPEVRAGRWQVSTAGGTSPRWSRDGRELFFVDESGLLSAAVSVGGGFAAAPPRRLFRVKPFGGRLGADYEVSADGRRFLFILGAPARAPATAELVYVQHWAEEVRAQLTQP